jgi:pSer/pThr/pTyr-binding forkhead associated (FHA) protein
MNLDVSRIGKATIFGSIAGFINFCILEPHIRAGELSTSINENVFVESMKGFAVLGLLVSVALVLADEMGSLSARRTMVRCGIAIAAGAVGGAVAGLIGQMFFSLLLAANSEDLLTVIVARTVGWAAVGGGIGIAGGLPSASYRKCLQGLLGGLVGGAIGGFVFDIISLPFNAGTISRLIGDTAVGTCVGFAVTVVEESAKVAWVTIVLGKNEGKQFILSKPTTTIGRDELSDIPLYGDLSVQKQHAVIQTADWRTFVFRDMGSPTGSFINGLRVTEKVLVDGDRIQIGKFHLLFNHRSGAPISPQPTDASSPMQAYQQLQDPSICPFCGTHRDAATGACACTPGVFTSVATTSDAAFIVGVAGPYTSVKFPIDRERVEIGRDPSNSIVLDADPTVSRKHAAIVRRGTSYFIEDLGSTNGTYVNGVRVQSAVLNLGDVVHIGGSSFRFGC